MESPLRLGVVGLGLVGLPVAVAFARRIPTLGFDVDTTRVALLRDGDDVLGQCTRQELADCGLALTTDAAALAGCDTFIITVPVTLDEHGAPDHAALVDACHVVGHAMKPGALVAIETTGWPGLTHEVCTPALSASSGLRAGEEFHVAYSPERINPGDGAHTFSSTSRVVAADDNVALARAVGLYTLAVDAPLHQVKGIATAEAAKLVENTQRDLNIALANELAVTFARMGLPTREILRAAGTKWNFAAYRPGLVGGACVGLAPRLLEQAARAAGAAPNLSSHGRAINDAMVDHVVDRLLRLMARAGLSTRGARVGILGCTYKPDIADARHSRIPDVVAQLTGLGMDVLVCDPVARAAEVVRHQKIHLTPPAQWNTLDAVVLAVAHQALLPGLGQRLAAATRRPAVCLDLAWMLDGGELPDGVLTDSL